LISIISIVISSTGGPFAETVSPRPIAPVTIR
jgi:hypothetical protein